MDQLYPGLTSSTLRHANFDGVTSAAHYICYSNLGVSGSIMVPCVPRTLRHILNAAKKGGQLWSLLGATRRSLFSSYTPTARANCCQRATTAGRAAGCAHLASQARVPLRLQAFRLGLGQTIRQGMVTSIHFSTVVGRRSSCERPRVRTSWMFPLSSCYFSHFPYHLVRFSRRGGGQGGRTSVCGAFTFATNRYSGH